MPLLLLSLILSSCEARHEVNSGYESQNSSDVVFGGRTLRVASFDELRNPLLVSMWGSEPKDSLLITRAERVGARYDILNSAKVPEGGAFVSVAYPSDLLRSGQYLLVSQSNQEPVYYYGGKVGSDGKADVALRRLQSQFTFQFDLKSFPATAQLEKVQLYSLYEYGWINLQNGTFETVEGNYTHQVPVTFPVQKTMREVRDRDGVYRCSLLSIPAKEQELMLKVIIDGQSYVVTFAPENMVSGADYLCEVMVMNRYEPVTLSNSEKNKGREEVTISQPAFPDFEYTLTSSYHKNLSNNHGAVFEFWVDSRVDQERELEYKLLIKDAFGNIVSQSPTYGGLTVKPYFYDGFQVPIYISVPRAGEYQYQILLRNKGNNEFYEPAQREDDLPQDKVLTIHDQQPVLATYFLLGGEHKGFATISKVPLNTPSHVAISLSNYSSREQTLRIRLYHRRNPLEDHSNLGAVISENPIASWSDLVGEGTVKVSPQASATASIPYEIKVSRPQVQRFPGYIAATIEYNNSGVELPLLKDGTLLYKYSHHLYNPNPIVNSSGVYNIAYIDVQQS